MTHPQESNLPDLPSEIILFVALPARKQVIQLLDDHRVVADQEYDSIVSTRAGDHSANDTVHLGRRIEQFGLHGWFDGDFRFARHATNVSAGLLDVGTDVGEVARGAAIATLCEAFEFESEILIVCLQTGPEDVCFGLVVLSLLQLRLVLPLAVQPFLPFERPFELVPDCLPSFGSFQECCKHSCE